MRHLSVATLFFVGVILACRWCGYETGPLRRLVHLQFYGAVTATGLIFVFEMQRRSRMANVACLFAVLLALPVARLWQKPPSQAGPNPRAHSLKVMTCNVYRNNDRYAVMIEALRKVSPDVLFLTEVSPAWHEALAPLRQHYPFAHGTGENLLLSRVPLEDTRTIAVTFETAQQAAEEAKAPVPRFDESLRKHWWNNHFLTAMANIGGSKVRLVCLHSPTPASDLSVTIQRACALAAAKELHADISAQASLLLGDLNTTCFSPTFESLLQQTQLVDSAKGFGYSPTWGPRLPREPLLPWIGLPIDHILVSKNVAVEDRTIGPATGSDHRWVMAKLSW